MELILETIINWGLDLISEIGYLGITLLMTIESSFIPFPSEIVIPPAAYLAQQGEMNIFLVILSGIIGSLLGALINYFLAYTLGRKIIYSLADSKILKFLLINKKKVVKAEKYFLKYGNFSTFIGRFIPAVRQLISIPAGFSKMNLKNFTLYTFLGSSIWVIVLAILGYAFGSNKELIAEYYEYISISFVVLSVILIIGLIIKNKIKK
ncbi:DedA family protein [Patescibacteria group bacterium]|nr:DedA family protein [Patescibacteria group bacterium]